MSTSGSWKQWMMLILLLINLVSFATAQDQNPYECMNNGNYTSNSTYSANLNSLLSSLASNINDTGFYSASVGRNLDTVNAVVLCRGDQTLDQCRNCVRNAAVGLVQLCPNQRQAIVWYELCTLRYSNEPLYGIQTNDPGVILRNSFNVSSAQPFGEDRTTLLDDLRRRAANGSSLQKAAAGFRNTSDSETIYGLLQCTPDLSPENCDNCLIRASQARSCCVTARGMRILLPSCNLRYELYPFYNETRLRELQLLAPPPPPSPSPSTPSPPGKKDDNKTRNIIIIVVAIALFLLIIAACAVIYVRKRIRRKPQELEEATDEISSVESLQFDFGKIRAATNDFSDANKLGQGGFGAVYLGKLPNGQEIAVKRLSRESGQGNIEFKNEVLLVAKLQHRNLVRLLGFSIEGTERLLIYEFVENASLDQFIFDPIKRSHLDWDTRYKIIAGIARGLVYLHEDSRLRIIHRDLKASNVLLDGDMNPKIADFGMARLVGQDETGQRNTSKIVGTYGYMSPEYAMHGQFSVKSDVFSFGVLVLEIISGQRNNNFENGESTEDLLSFTWKNWRDGTAGNVIDPVLRADSGSRQDMLRCIHIGLLCVQEIGANRPTMASVVLMLNSTTITLQVPSEPPFLMSTHFGPDISRFQNYDSKESNSSKASRFKTGISEGSSQNDVSVTELYPR
ncbi:Cysteine-rich receptor-like protein kinase [Sesamum alatum]|uniref:Cysteine-rich receptor-like protein kinase n=1 Tax=Sesamum alatum TaxID=300844 RepID=A0AAE1Z0H0_9LAMI|nr:Cysteine-rich receptor-like protein kinase [Sesamum alatum]